MNTATWTRVGLLAAVVCAQACSAKSGANGVLGSGVFGSGGSTAIGGVHGGAAGSVSAPSLGGNSTAPPGSLGPVMTRPPEKGSGPDGSCGDLPFEAEQLTTTKTITHDVPQPIDLYIMWDQSLSMSCAITNGMGGAGGMGGMGGAPATTAANRWDAVKTPLSAWVQSVPADPPFNVGIGYFGDNVLIPSCDRATYAKPDVEIGPLPMNATPIINSLNAHMPSTTTPTPPALQGALDHATVWKANHPTDVVAVVLVTDGQPNGACGAIPDVVAAAQAGWNNGMGVRTFVIGVTSPGTMCNLDPNPPNVPDLDMVAAAGGTDKALVVDVTQDAAKQLTDLLNKIRTSITQTTTKTEVKTSKLACEYSLPASDPNQSTHIVVDKDKVNVNFTSNMGMKEQVYRVDSLDKCSSTNAKAWYYDNNMMPTKILMCPTACTAIQGPGAGMDGGLDPSVAGMAPTVHITLGCMSIYAPPA